MSINKPVCPIADTFENLSNSNVIFKDGQRIYDTTNKKWKTGDGNKTWSQLDYDTTSSGSGEANVDLSGYQTIENLSDNYSDPELFKENGYLSQSGAFNLYTEIMAERLSPISEDIEELNKKVTTFEELPNLLDAISTSVSWAHERSKTDGANRYYNTILDFLNETQVDNPDGPGPDIYTEPAFAAMMLPKGSIITIATKSIPNLQVLEINSDGFTSDLADIEQTEENLASQINDLLNTNGYFYTKWIKFGKFCDESSGGSEILQEELDRLNYYGDKDIVPSDENLFVFTPNDDKTASISLKEDIDRGSITELVIPYKYIDNDEKEYKITSFDNGMFVGCSNLTSVMIPNSVTNIDDGTFYNCSNLTSVTLPNSITSIGDEVFYRCSKLTSIMIPNSVTSIGNFAFQGCSNLTSITIPNGVTDIGDGAFTDCNLTSVTIPNGVTGIRDAVFSGCSNLISVMIPNSVTSISYVAFYHCSEDLTIICNPDSTAEAYAKENGIKYAYNYVKSEDLGGSSADLSGYQTIENMMTSNDFSDSITEKTDDKYVSAKAVYDVINEVNSRIDNLDNQSDIEDLKNNTTFGQNAYSEGENSTEGIAIGYNAMTGVNGVAIGPDACNKGTLENGMPYYTSAIQLGRGTNPNDGTFQVYNYQLLDAEGKIPAERLPEGIGSSSTSTELSNFIINATGSVNNITCDVTVGEIAEAAESGKTPILKIDSPEVHSGTIIAYCEGIYNTESGGYRANFRYDFGLHSSYEIICDGPQNRWYSQVSYPVVGETEYINLQMADAANSTKIDQNTTAINDISKNMISKNSNSLLIGNGATIVSGTTNNVVIGQAANVYSGDNNIVMGQDSSTDGDRNVAIGYSSSTHGKEGVAIGYGAITSGGVAIGGSACAFKSDPINAIQLGNGTNPNEGTFQVYDYQLLDAEGKIPEERISNMFYLDGDNLKINIGGKTFTLTPDAE